MKSTRKHTHTGTYLTAANSASLFIYRSLNCIFKAASTALLWNGMLAENGIKRICIITAWTLWRVRQQVSSRVWLIAWTLSPSMVLKIEEIDFLGLGFSECHQHFILSSQVAKINSSLVIFLGQEFSDKLLKHVRIIICQVLLNIGSLARLL